MELIEILKAVLFGIVEGITEWLPISSTGHMILLNEVLPLDVSDEFYSMFEVVIQLGAILAVVILFWSQIWPFGKKNNVAPLSKKGPGAWIKKDIFILWFHILVSCVPAAIVGILFDELFEKWFYNYTTVAIMLILFGIAFIVIENYHKGKSAKINSIADIGYDTAMLISADRSNFSGNLAFRSDDRRSTFNWCVKNGCSGIYVLSRDSGYVWCQPVKTDQIRTLVYDGRGSHSDRWYGGSVCCVIDRNTVPDGIY